MCSKSAASSTSSVFIFVFFAFLSVVSSKPLNETLTPSNWTSERLENGRFGFKSPTGRFFNIQGLFDLVQTVPQAVHNLPSLLQPLGINLIPQGIKLDGSWLFDQVLSMTREMMPLPETVFFGGSNEPIRMGSMNIRVGSAMFYNGHLKGHGSVKRNGPAEVILSANSRSSVASGLIWDTLELLYEIDIEIFGLIRQPRQLLATIEAIGFTSKMSVNPTDFVHFFDPVLEVMAMVDIGHVSLKHKVKQTSGPNDILSRLDDVIDAYMQNIMEKTVYPRLELNLKLGLKDATKWLNVLGLKSTAVLTA